MAFLNPGRILEFTEVRRCNFRQFQHSRQMASGDFLCIFFRHCVLANATVQGDARLGADNLKPLCWGFHFNSRFIRQRKNITIGTVNKTSTEITTNK
jgi:hypothetical protein